MDCSQRVLLDGLDRSGEGQLLLRRKQLQIVTAGVALLVLLLLDGEDVGAALDAREQVRAVVGLQELAQRFDALHDQREVVLSAEREHGVDEVGTCALLAKVDLQPVSEEAEQIQRLAVHLGAVEQNFGSLLGNACHGEHLRELLLHCRHERQPQIVLQHQTDHAQRRTAELIGIAGAGRLLADRPEADEGIELVGEGDGHCNRVAVLFLRHRVRRALGLVVQLDGAGDLGLGADGFRVVAAHQALQLGELSDHAGDEIGLA